MLSLNTIATAIYSHVQTGTGLPAITLYPDSTSSPVDDHVRIWVLPNTTQNPALAVDSYTIQEGIVQLSVFVKSSPNATFTAGDYIQAASELFRRGLRLGDLQFKRSPKLSNTTHSAGFTTISLSAEYTIINQNKGTTL